ncbi:hypothetical protein ACHAP7_011285 [Fusarium lateritium]
MDPCPKASTDRFRHLRDNEYDYLDKQGHVYLDYTGSGLAAQSQYLAHYNRVQSILLGNPHSTNPTSAAATDLVEQTRSRILEFFNASKDEYTVIFTPNASGAARLVGESFPFSKRSRLVLTADNHNSINGLRMFAERSGTKTVYVPLEADSLRIDESSLLKRLPDRTSSLLSRKSRSLFAYTAQSNFSGVQHPLTWVKEAQRRGYDVLLDAAAFVPTNHLNLSKVHPDFVIVSWYKVFGYPTGVGCLIARREAQSRLSRPWFAGGTVQAVTVGHKWELLLRDERGFEDGTINFQSIPDVLYGIDWICSIGLSDIKRHVMKLTQDAIQKLQSLSHSNGILLIKFYGPTNVEDRGATISFNLCDPTGKNIDDRVVGLEAAVKGISLRTGCFCNPGAGETALGVTERMIRQISKATIQDLGEYLELVNLDVSGVVRISFGLASSEADVDKLCDFLKDQFCDRPFNVSGLGPREGC